MIKIKICNLSLLENKNYLVKWVDKIKDELIIYKIGKKIYIKSSICPHFGGPITFNKNENYLYCNWHGLKFSHDGKCMNQKNFKACLNNYDYEIKDNYVYVKK